MTSTALPNATPSLRSHKSEKANLDETPIAYGIKDEEARAGNNLPSYSPDDDSSHNLKPVSDSTHRKLKPRHIQLIGIGGTIGTALYVQIGRGLLNGGPGSLFIAFTFW